MGQHHGAPSYTGSLEGSGVWSFSGQAGMWERGLGVSEVLLGCAPGCGLLGKREAFLPFREIWALGTFTLAG